MEILNMFPCSSMNNICNYGLRNSQRLGHLRLIKRAQKLQISNIFNIFFRKLSSRMIFAFVSPMSSSFYCIINVLTLGASIKMNRINTSWVITGMTNIFSFRNFTIMKFIRCHVGRKIFISISHGPISCSSFCPSPFPTSMKWDHSNVFPKLVFYMPLHGGVL